MKLEAQYKNDPVLLAFYTKKLLLRGWAGAKTAEEKEYIARMKRIGT